MSERPLTMTAETEEKRRACIPKKGWIKDVFAELDAERAAHQQERTLSDQLAEAIRGTRCSHCGNTGYGSDGEFKFKCHCGYEQREAALAKHKAQRDGNILASQGINSRWRTS